MNVHSAVSHARWGRGGVQTAAVAARLAPMQLVTARVVSPCRPPATRAFRPGHPTSVRPHERRQFSWRNLRLCPLFYTSLRLRLSPSEHMRVSAVTLPLSLSLLHLCCRDYAVELAAGSMAVQANYSLPSLLAFAAAPRRNGGAYTWMFPSVVDAAAVLVSSTRSQAGLRRRGESAVTGRTAARARTGPEVTSPTEVTERDRTV
jgi:hypothetical protein